MFPLCHTPTRPFFGFPGSDLILRCGLRDQVITRFASGFEVSLFGFGVFAVRCFDVWDLGFGVSRFRVLRFGVSRLGVCG